jgi:predicted Zn finger-like uncharacterized protein
MRLTCPNCAAQYEVDEKVIPQIGRDVQCSACGHTWYQYPMEVALQMRAAEMEDDDDEDDGPPPLPTDGTGRQQAPRIDKTVLDVLREEAELEMTARNRPAASLETQGDLGLTRPTRSKSAPPRSPREEDEPVAVEPVRRRSLLPDIEELTSTLEPGRDSRRDGDEDDEDIASEERRGFRNGLSMVILIAMFLIAIYMLAPLIAAYVPALEGALTQYVTVINDLRAMVSDQLRGLIGG